MLQLIGLLALSWLLLWLFDKKNLTVLGLMPTPDRLLLMGKLFLLTAACCATALLMKIGFAKEQYILNPNLTAGSALFKIWENIRGVLTEELLCRGALLFILIKKLGSKWAIIISSVIFAVLHWLNAGVWGNVVQMALVFVFTFSMGLLLAYAYTKTYSILIPFAIHLGWNLTESLVFSDNPQANPLFVLAAPPPVVTVSYVAFFMMLLFPKVSAIGLDYWVLRRQKQIVRTGIGGD
jgi:membrane protease YdiL (CAAX protease family)